MMDIQELTNRIDMLCVDLKGLNVESPEARRAAAEECDKLAEDLRQYDLLNRARAYFGLREIPRRTIDDTV